MELTKSLSRRSRLVLRGLLAVLLLTIVAAIVVGVRWRQELAVRKAFTERLVHAFEGRLPELEPDELNASDVLSAAIHLLRLAAKEEPRRKIPRASLRLDEATADEDLVRRARERLALPHNRLALELMDLDATVARARFQGSRHVFGWAVGAEYYSDLRVGVLRLAELLETRAFVAVQSGQAEDAYRDVEILLRMADWLRMEQAGIVSWLFRNAVVARATEALEELRRSARAPAERRDRLGRLLERLAEHDKAWGLEGERAFTYSLLWRDAARRGVPTYPDEQSYELYENLIGRARTLPYERVPLVSTTGEPTYTLGGHWQLIPNLMDSVVKTDVAALRIELALLSLAWDDYHDLRGAYPPEPGALVPDFLEALPLDPWSGEDLEWRADGTVCRLYSLGPDRRAEDEGEAPDSDDVSWRLPCRQEAQL